MELKFRGVLCKKMHMVSILMCDMGLDGTLTCDIKLLYDWLVKSAI